MIYSSYADHVLSKLDIEQAHVWHADPVSAISAQHAQAERHLRIIQLLVSLAVGATGWLGYAWPTLLAMAMAIAGGWVLTQAMGLVEARIHYRMAATRVVKDNQGSDDLVKYVAGSRHALQCQLALRLSDPAWLAHKQAQIIEQNTQKTAAAASAVRRL